MHHPRFDLELHPVRSLECPSRFLQDSQEDQAQHLRGPYEDEEKEITLEINIYISNELLFFKFIINISIEYCEFIFYYR